jgi:hypothetical protein
MGVRHHLKDEDVVQIVKSDRHQLEDGVVGRCRLTQYNPCRKRLGTKRLKRKYDEPLSDFAFKCNLRRYSMGRFATSKRNDPNRIGDRVKKAKLKT